jgi:hypothetical protein
LNHYVERERETLTGGVEAALTTKDTLLGDWVGLPPTIFLVASTEEAIEDESSA